MGLAHCPVGGLPVADPDRRSPTCCRAAAGHQDAGVPRHKWVILQWVGGILEQDRQLFHLPTVHELGHLFVFTQKLRDTWRRWLLSEGRSSEDVLTSWCWNSLSSRRDGGVGTVPVSGVTRPGSPAGRGTSGGVTGGRQTPFFSLSLSLSRLLSHSTMKTSANPPETSSPNPCFPSPSLSPCSCLFSPQVCESRAAGVGVKPASVCWHCGEPGHFEDQCHVMEVGALVQIPDLPLNEHTL